MKSSLGLVLLALAGCGGASNVCQMSVCTGAGNLTFTNCAQPGGDVVYTFGASSCTCKTGDVSGCQACAALVAGYCGAGPTGGSDGGVDGGGMTGGPDCTPGAGGNTAKFVFKTMMLPTQRTDYAMDLTGSGRAENQFGIIFGAFAQQGVGPQPSLDAALSAGQENVLLAETSSDATFQTDTCATATVQRAVATTTPPTLGGTYVPTGTASLFVGPITAGMFSSAPPATTKKPVTLQLPLPLVAGASPILLNIIGAHVQLTYSGGQISGGQINGAIKKSDVDNTVVPALAQSLAQKIAADKGNPTSMDMSILTLFDTGGSTGATMPGCATTCANTCQNRMGAPNSCGCATANDGVIDECEVASNSIMRSIVAPDVQMFDAAGNYAPNPAPTASGKDSLSIGLAFTAVPAKF